MKQQKQLMAISYLVASKDLFTVCRSIIRPDYFDPEYRNAVQFIIDYYEKYSSLPTADLLEAETDVSVKRVELTSDAIQYHTNEIEHLCKRKAMEAAIINSVPLIEKGDYGQVEQLVRNALLVSLTRDLGLDYFQDPLTRLEHALTESKRVSTGWKDFDDAIGGGLARTEILLMSANSGGGKSIFLSNVAVNFLTQGYSVLYITLELSQELVAQRFDTMFTSIPSVNWRARYQDIANTLVNLAPHMGKLLVKRLPSGTNSNVIRSYVKEFQLCYGFTPDLLVVDYLDILGANEHVSADNVFEKDKRATEQLRDILFEYNMFCATASQQNRSAINNPDLSQGHIAGGISKVNTVDVYASIILSDVMKAAGEMGIKFLKTRNSDGVGKTISLKWDNNALRIYNMNKSGLADEDGIIIDRVMASKNKSRKSLLDLMD